MKRLLFVIGTLLVTAILVEAQPETRVRVVGQRVNLRAKADTQSEVVGQVADGDVLVAQSFQEEWVEVLPPEGIDVWVHREFIKDNKVLPNRLQCRAGPGINFSVIGSVQKGDVVVPRGEFGEWIRIAPPPSASLWISRPYVAVLEPEKPLQQVAQTAEPLQSTVARQTGRQHVDHNEDRKIEAPAPTSVQAVQVHVRPPVTPVRDVAEEPKPPADLKLIPLEGQGRSVQREGVLRLAGIGFRRPSPYRLVRIDGNRLQTICYLRGNSRQMQSLLGQRLLIRGREYWVQGAEQPVVVPEQIVPRVN